MSRIFSYALKIIESVSDWAGKIFSFSVLAAIMVVVYAVIMRYVFNNPPYWGLELTIYFCMAIYAMGGAYAHLSDSHVKVDLIYGRWSERTRAIIDLIASPIFLVALGMLLWSSGEWAIEAIVGNRTSGTVWAPIIWPVRMLLPLGTLLLMLQGIANLTRAAKIAVRGSQT